MLTHSHKEFALEIRHCQCFPPKKGEGQHWGDPGTFHFTGGEIDIYNQILDAIVAILQRESSKG